jgi:putative CRISPR-associated protein (TIGR02619 family)
MRNTLICTVGTSLLEVNLKRLAEDPDKFNNPPANAEELIKAYQLKDPHQIANQLLCIDPAQRICGAEINTVEEVRGKKWLSLEHLLFLVSDTSAGKLTGQILQSYFKSRKNLDLKTVEYKVVDKLQDERPKDFKIHGLRNLVREIGSYLKRFGLQNTALDATGGYKAQIALAVVIGQALDIPVYYKHERFSEIIDFPPLPITLDYEVLAENADILTDFERGEVFSSSDLGNIGERLKVLLTEVSSDNEILYELNPIGQIYLTGFRLRYQTKLTLQKASQRKPPTFRDDHYPKGFQDFVKKVWDENDWVETAYSMDYSGQKSIKGIGFKVIQNDQEKILIGTYQDKDLFGARFGISLPDESLSLLTLAADRLNQKYRQ